jgi:hypothetical protein
VSPDELAKLIPADDQLLSRALGKLVDEARVTREQKDGNTAYSCDQCLVGLDQPSGWEAAIFDHYQAMVTTITTKLRAGAKRALQTDLVGGATYTFDVWEGHPHYGEVAGFLKDTRGRAVALRAKVDSFNAGQEPPPEDRARKFVAYVGQTVLQSATGGDTE